MTLANPAVAAASLVLAGLMALYAAAGAPGWIEAGPMPQVASATALLLSLAVASMAMRWTTLKGRSELGAPGLAAMVLGGAVLAGGWLTGHGTLPVGELVLPMHETRQAYEVKQGSRQVDVMLPLRMTLESVVLGDEPRVDVVFSRLGPDGVPPQTLGVGESLDVSGLRFAFVGLVTDTAVYRAVVRSEAENTIPAAGVVGDSLSVSINGPSYTVVATTSNYLDAMGPAVQLEDGEGRRFWVFEEPESEARPDFADGLWLEELQEVPAAVMQVSPVRPFGVLGIGAGLCVAGFLLLCFGGLGMGRSADESAEGGAADDAGSSDDVEDEQ
ncbi:hypothetical protein FRC98_02105 [Lujinxingia vulgaris]|uniref:ResB-like domain-containing protein n=1 Tax=Lujinxingia vulgaris TaxID=2600176 RepID=A0A5C6XLX1_9DELT|nr:hypothetical protein [Lujinxingia vulgaris]TXD39215.1 hypothetical protein FRC98_02105 [Lujinxingia vulgaris]